MKIRSAYKRGYHTDLSFEDFLLNEFSTSQEEFKPLTEISCNECPEGDLRYDVARTDRDCPLSFLVKFKAHLQNGPSNIKPNALGFRLPDDEELSRRFGLEYRREAGDENHFSSVEAEHYNLYIDAKNVEDFARYLFLELGKPTYPHHYVEPRPAEYFREAGKTNAQWRTLLSRPEKENWLRYFRQLILREYSTKYGMINQQDLESALKKDPAGLIAALKNMHALNALSVERIEKIKKVKGLERVL